MTSATGRPLEELSDKGLHDRVRAAERTIREIDATDPAELARERKTEEAITRLESAVETVETANAELERRRLEDKISRLPGLRAIREAWKGPHPAIPTLNTVTRFGHAELLGETLVASRLTAEETEELEALVKRRLAVAKGQDGAEPLTEAEQARYEEILGVTASDDRGLFERKRTEAAAREKIAEITKAQKRHPHAAPTRPHRCRMGRCRRDDGLR